MSKTPKKKPAATANPEPAIERAAPVAAADAIHITQFQAENFKKLRVVQITPGGHVITLTGANGSGKSSVLDAIYMALCGTSKRPTRPIRKGAAKAAVQVTIGDLQVTRRWSEGHSEGGYLEVWSKDGRQKYKGPQELLNNLMGPLAIDPVAFINMEPEKQLETLRRLVTIDVDIDKLDTDYKADYQRRRELKRDIDALGVRIGEVKVPADLSPERIDVADLTRQIREANEANEARQTIVAAVQNEKNLEEAAQRSAESERARARDIDKEIEQLTRSRDAHQAHAAEHDKAIEAHKKKRLAYKVPEPINTNALTAQIDAARTVNAGHELKARRDELTRERDGLQVRVDSYTQQMENNRETRTEAIAEAKMPLPGLSFEEDAVTLDGIPFAQLSDGEQIKVSISLAMSGNPKLRVLMIKDGSLLDSKGLEQVATMAAENNYQVWMEVVDSSGKVGIVMEEGENEEGRNIRLAQEAKEAKRGARRE